jgi:signal transduction histidine kinase/CheY-like chemotaxis protein
VYYQARGAVSTAALETAKALSLVTDREFAVRAAVLRTLATSPSLAHGDLQAFYQEARTAMPSLENTIVLTDLSGQQLLNTRLPFNDAGLPRSTNLHMPQGPELPALIVSDLYQAQVARQFSFAVNVPVLKEGRPAWYLGMGSFASQMQRIFEQHPLPEGWIGVVLDAKGSVVARNRDPDKMIGRQASPDMMAALAASAQGVHATNTLGGVPVLTAFTRARESGWSVLIALPREDLRRPALQALGSMLLTSLLFTAGAVFIAFRLGRRIIDPLKRLQSDAEALGRGQPVDEAPTGLVETDAVQRLLAEASRERAGADERLRTKVSEALAEAERAYQAALSVQKLEALGRLTGGIAHDFNNLLQTMTTGLQLAMRLASDARAERALAACGRATAKAVKLTRQLMTFGRSQAGYLEVIDLKQQLPALRDLVEGAVREAIAVTIEVDAAVWPVEADPVQLELAVLNLALNSRDAMQASGALSITAGNRKIGAGTVAGLAAGDYVAIGVRDSGEGIAPELLARVFDPFFTTKPVGKGSGLGLAQVYGFAQKSGGIATVRSELGQGSEVTIWLPRSRKSPFDSVRPAEPELQPHYRGTVLMVEDDALVRELISEALTELGFVVVTAASAADALATVRARQDIDVVLSDIVMPGVQSGLDLANTLKLLRPLLPVVLASGYSEQLDSDVPFPVIAKPYDVDQVARHLAHALSGAPRR